MSDVARGLCASVTVKFVPQWAFVHLGTVIHTDTD